MHGKEGRMQKGIVDNQRHKRHGCLQDTAAYKCTSNLLKAFFAGYAQGLQCETCFVLTTIDIVA